MSVSLHNYTPAPWVIREEVAANLAAAAEFSRLEPNLYYLSAHELEQERERCIRLAEHGIRYLSWRV